MENKKNNSGALFVNNNRKSETHPNMKGSVVIEGVEYWISAWKKVTEKQEIMFSLSFQVKEEKPNFIPNSVNENKDISDFLNDL